MFASALALIADAHPVMPGRASALAAYGATVGASFAVGPPIGSALASGPGWRWIYLINLPIGVMALLRTARRVRESRDVDARRIDVPGLLTLTAGLFLLVLALLRGRDQGWTSFPTLAEFGGAAVLSPVPRPGSGSGMHRGCCCREASC